MTPTYDIINVVLMNMDPGLGEFVLGVERLLVASESLFISSGTSGSTKWAGDRVH